MKPSGGGTTVTPIAPPASLFPGITEGFRGAVGEGLGKTGAKSLSDIISGANLEDIFSKISAANQRQVKTDEASLKESFGSSGMRYSSSLMKSLTDYHLQNQAQLSSQFAQLGLQNEQMQLGGLSLLQGLATSFAPTQVVSQNPAGASPFSQIASAGEAAMMLFLMAGAGCWVAASFWGWDDYRTHYIRGWVNSLAPRWFAWVYKRWGRGISRTPLRWMFRVVFEFVMWKENFLA